MARMRVLTDEQLAELLATKNKQERIKLAIKFNIGSQSIFNLYQYYKHKPKKVEELMKQPDFSPLQMIMMPNLEPNEIKVNGTKMEFPSNRAVIQGIEFSW
jgi:hypothetical protein